MDEPRALAKIDDHRGVTTSQRTKHAKHRLDLAAKVQSWLLNCSQTHIEGGTTTTSTNCCNPRTNDCPHIHAINHEATTTSPPATAATVANSRRPSNDDDSSVDTTQYIKSNRCRMHNLARRHRRRTNALQKLRDRPADNCNQHRYTPTAATHADLTRNAAGNRNPPFIDAAKRPAPAPPIVDQVVPHMPPCACAAAPLKAAADGRPFRCKGQKLRTLKQLNARVRPRPSYSSSVSSSSLLEQSTGVQSEAFRAQKANTRPKRRRRLVCQQVDQE